MSILRKSWTDEDVANLFNSEPHRDRLSGSDDGPRRCYKLNRLATSP